MSNDDEEANQFAIELLMPDHLVRIEVRKLGGIDIMDDDQIKKLAKKFGVNGSLMSFRIGQLSTATTAPIHDP